MALLTLTALELRKAAVDNFRRKEALGTSRPLATVASSQRERGSLWGEASRHPSIMASGTSPVKPRRESSSRKSIKDSVQLPAELRVKNDWFGLKKWLISSQARSQGRLITFDSSTGDLVLGLHPDNYANDPGLSAYARR